MPKARGKDSGDVWALMTTFQSKMDNAAQREVIGYSKVVSLLKAAAVELDALDKSRRDSVDVSERYDSAVGDLDGLAAYVAIDAEVVG